MKPITELSILAKEIISKICIDKSNFEYCAKNNIINGTLLQGIRAAMQEYASRQTAKYKELIEMQDELIKELSESEPACMYVKELEDKIEQLKTELNQANK